MVVVGISMLLPGLVGIVYRETRPAMAFFAVAVPMIVLGLLAIKMTPKEDNSVLRMRDGFFIVAVSWMLMSALGGLPFMITGDIPNFIDAFFETASGFTTTGSTVVIEPEAMAHATLFWRSFTHWLGGMGVLVLTVALLPMLGIGGQKIMRAETPGPTMDKLSATMSTTAKTLYTIYTGMTIIEIVLLVIAGMGFFDACCHTFGTVGTGGLSTRSASIGYYNSVSIDLIISFFMMFAGINFGLYHYLFSGSPKQFFKDPELRAYVGIMGGATAFMAIMLYGKGFYESLGQAFRYAFFQASSIMTTTGYGTADFDLWPVTCKIILFILMIIGGCAGSTGGGIKVIRAVIVAKAVKRSAERRLHPNAFKPLKVGGKSVSVETLNGVCGYITLFVATTLIGTLLISLENVSFTTALSSVIACLCNIGPGFELVGPTCNYAFLSYPAKSLLAMLMIAGRLELYTIILMLTPQFWNKNR